MQSRNKVGDVGTGGSCPSIPRPKLRSHRAQKTQQRTPQGFPPSLQAIVTAPSAPSPDAPQQCPPSSGEGGSQKKALPEGLSPELAPQLTPTLAASSGFPNRSQVWARCPGRKWGAGPREGQHSRPCCPRTSAEHRHHPSSWEGVGATHALPRSPWPRSPIQGGSLQNQILSPFF